VFYIRECATKWLSLGYIDKNCVAFWSLLVVHSFFSAVKCMLKCSLIYILGIWGWGHSNIIG